MLVMNSEYIMQNIAITIFILIISTANGSTTNVNTAGIANIGSRFILTNFRHISSTHESSGLFLFNPDSTNSAEVVVGHKLNVAINGDLWSIGTQSSVYIDIPGDYSVNKGSQLSSTGFEINSSIPISIRMINNAAFSDDTILVFPYSELGMEYYVITPPCQGRQTYKEVKIVSASAYTVVKVTLAGNQSLLFLTLNGKNYYGEDSFEVTLNKYDVLQLSSFLDLTGTKITASTFVSVFSGCDFEYSDYIQSVNISDFHHQAEQVVDKERLGRHFDFHSIYESTLIIVATEERTWVRLMIDDVCEQVDFASSGNITKLLIKEHSIVIIDSSHPLLVATGSDLMNNYIYQTPLEQGIRETTVCVGKNIEIQFHLSVNSNCTNGFVVNNYPVTSTQFTLECYDVFDNHTGRCFLTSRMYRGKSGCYNIQNTCDSFSGRMVISSEIEETLGNAMNVIDPTCEPSNPNPQHSCIEDVTYTCNISSNSSLKYVQNNGIPDHHHSLCSMTTTSSQTTTTTTLPQTSDAGTTAGSGGKAADALKCVCYASGSGNITKEVLHRMSQRKKELQLDRKALSSTVRSKTSAPDSRPSARAVGGTAGIAIMTLVFGGILLFDLPFFITFLQQAVKFLKPK